MNNKFVSLLALLFLGVSAVFGANCPNLSDAYGGSWTQNVAAGSSATLTCPALTQLSTFGNNPLICDVGTCNDAVQGTLLAGGVTQRSRLTRNGVAGKCATPKTYPGASTTTQWRYKTHTFVNTGSSAACITVSFSSAATLQAGLYLTAYNASNLGQNYLSDAGSNTISIASPLTFSGTVPAGATFLVVVNDAGSNTAALSYTFSVSGTSSLTCSPTAVWRSTQSPKFCSPISCPTLTDANGQWTSNVGIGGTATLVCTTANYVPANPSGTSVACVQTSATTVANSASDLAAKTTCVPSTCSALTDALGSWTSNVQIGGTATLTCPANYDITGGAGSVTCNSGSCGDSQSISSSITPTSALQINRAFRDGVSSGTCGSNKVWAGLSDSVSTGYHYNTHQFTNPSTSPACVTITVTSSSDVFASLYIGSYDPSNQAGNFYGNAGKSTSQNSGSNSFGATVPAGSVLVVVVVETVANSGTSQYTVTVDGVDKRPCSPSYSDDTGMCKDIVAPVIQTLFDLETPATSPAGATVDYGTVTATDAVSGTITPTCLPESGSVFAIGTTTVTCTATDPADNTASKTFTVTVSDGVAPDLQVPENINITASSMNGEIVTFTVTATDNVDSAVTVVCDPASGFNFPIGTTTVYCYATDLSGNTGYNFFFVTVNSPGDIEPPVFSTLSNILGVTNTVFDSSAIVSWPTVFAEDAISGAITATCEPASGSSFPVLTWTTVTCTATDEAGNSATTSFKVNVGVLNAGCSVTLYDGLAAGSCPVPRNNGLNGNRVFLNSGKTCTYALQPNIGFNANTNGYGVTPSLSCLNGILSSDVAPSLYRIRCPLPRYPTAVDAKATAAEANSGSCGIANTLAFGSSCYVRLKSGWAASPDAYYRCDRATPFTGSNGLTEPSFTKKSTDPKSHLRRKNQQ